MRRLFLACLVLGLAVAIPRLASGVAGAAAPAFTQSETLTRDFDVNGADTVVDTRQFSVSVSQTANLVGRQEVNVSWTGAHPTGGAVADENSIDAQYEEYPVVLLECRGVDSANPPAGEEQVTPQTCWTNDWTERYQQAVGDPYPPWRLDAYASAADTQAVVGAPSVLPASCTGAADPYSPGNAAPVQYWLPWQAADGTTYYGGDVACAGAPPEADDTSALPSNETFGVTGTDGSGSAQFDVFTSQQNQTLGCSTTVACSLVVVPIMGISCNVNASTPTLDVDACEETGHYNPGTASVGDPTLPQLTVTGSLWWSASNWRDRISIPLSFGTTSTACSLTGANASNSIDIYGSELMIRATDQWEPYFCLGDDNNDDFSFVHVQTGEPEARNLVASGGAEAALTEMPQNGGYPVPTANAPVAMTGFTIAYSVSGSNGQQYADLKLTPLLLAKLLTESYPDITELVQAASSTGGTVDLPGLVGNPYNITDDPEFEQLNPGIPVLPPDTDSAAELISLSSDSDVIEALTTYINDDPTARAWLDGNNTGEPNTCNAAGNYQSGATGPCPAMAVNPAYKGIQLPVDQWPLLTPPDSSKFYESSWMQNNNPCLATSYPPGIPYLNQVASPLATLESIAEDMQFDEPNSEVSCQQVNGSSVGEKLVADPRQGAGNYFMLGITPLADDSVYGLQSAQLQTTPGTFVSPTEAALQATAALLQPDPASGTWPIPYSAFETASGQSAYPGSMVVYLAVPTQGLPTADAAALGQILEFAATTGQEQGSGIGQLPDGYLPLDTADGLGTLADYTQAAAADVSAQNGQLPVFPGAAAASSTASGSAAASSSTVPSQSGSGGSIFPLPSATGSFPFELTGRTGTLLNRSPLETVPLATRSKRRPIPIPSVLALDAAAARLQPWFTTLSGILELGVALAILLFFPVVLLLGRRRAKW